MNDLESTQYFSNCQSPLGGGKINLMDCDNSQIVLFKKREKIGYKLSGCILCYMGKNNLLKKFSRYVLTHSCSGYFFHDHSKKKKKTWKLIDSIHPTQFADEKSADQRRLRNHQLMTGSWLSISYTLPRSCLRWKRRSSFST